LQESNELPDSQDLLDAWIKESWPRAVVYARSLLHERALADDVVQDCFCSLLRKSGDYDLPRDGAGLLMKSVTRACLKKNTRARPTISLNAASRGESCPAIDPVDPTAAEPPRLVLHAELELVMEAALAALPELQRAAIELKAMGHAVREIAEILDVSPSNAGVLIHRGRQSLAKRLAPYLENRPDERTGRRSAE
jgi:RNA polymerase sigma factor (sigma-70 family)